MFERVVVLIPCYNEAQTIEKVVTDFKEALPEARIYVYDNNSTDDTADIAHAAGAVVVHEYCQGKGNVIRSMFRDIHADCYVMVDGDDTYPADYAREMVEKILNGKADMVIGDRLSSTYFTENKRKFHNSGNKLVRKLVNRLFSGEIMDIMTGYRAFSSLFVKTFPILSKGFEIETEMSIHALDKKLRVVSVPVTYRDRPHGSVSKLNTFSDGFKVLFTIFNLFKDYRPLAFFSIIALILTIISTVLFVPLLYNYLQTGLVPQFPTLIVSGFVMIAALLSLSCGLILDSLKRRERQDVEFKLNTMQILRDGFGRNNDGGEH